MKEVMTYESSLTPLSSPPIPDRRCLDQQQQQVAPPSRPAPPRSAAAGGRATIPDLLTQGLGDFLSLKYTNEAVNWLLT
ncbi:hypothetical protein H5410_028463 [Solanum commersonii]|uniref:Uncharacterized protein n=1 Tax=Solanum commersonii TaxID=4109 RepID=A0A9J5Z210_SOLCO|nr:hypothetical protein H5410_028463 [Solanum commersonii]